MFDRRTDRILIHLMQCGKKLTAVYYSVSAKQLDVLAITKIWQQRANDLLFKRCALLGYAVAEASSASCSVCCCQAAASQ